MDVTTEPITAVMGRAGMVYSREVLGQNSFASLTSCRLSTVARVCEVVWQATATLTS